MLAKVLLAALCPAALCLLGFGVATANSATLHDCKKEAAGATGVGYTNNACNVRGTGGEFETVPVVGSQTVIPKLASAKASLTGTISSIEYEMACTGVTSGNSKAENTSGAETIVKGSGKATLLGCEIAKPAGLGCVVPETLETVELKSSTEGMASRYVPAEGSKIMTVEITECTGTAKSLNGTQVLEGSAVAVTEATSPSDQKFTEASGSSLKFGGQSTKFTATIEYKTANGSHLGLRGQPVFHECSEGEGTGTVSFTSSSCSAIAEAGKFKTGLIEGSQAVIPVLTSETASFNLNVGGVSLETACTGLTSANSKVENSSGEGEVKEATVIKGSGTLKFTGCKVTKPAGKGCTVPATLETVNLKTSSAGLSSLKLEPASGSQLFTLVTTGCTIPVLNGEKSTVGSLAALTHELMPTAQEFTESSGTALAAGGQNVKFLAVIHFQTGNGTKLALEMP